MIELIVYLEKSVQQFKIIVSLPLLRTHNCREIITLFNLKMYTYNRYSSKIKVIASCK